MGKPHTGKQDSLNTTETDEIIQISDSRLSLIPALTIVFSPDRNLWGHSIHPGTRPVIIRRGTGMFGPELNDTQISRQHAEIRPVGNGIFEIADTGSKNGTYVNARRIPEHGTKLKAGDVIRTGNTLFLFHYSRPSFHAGKKLEESSLVGISEAAQNVRHLIRVNASLNCNVLILGETGTGKELVAREIHRLNRGSKMPFVAFNCGTIPKDLLDAELFGCVKGAFTDAKRDRSGLFLSADEGSLFLDEVGELPHESQVKLLRVLEEKEVTPLGSSVPRKVNVRVMAATNRDLKKDISGKMFRPDLFARLAQSIVVTPPLRERREDIPFLLEHFMKEGGRMGRTLDPDTMEELLLHPFPFNVRELKSLVELMLAECGQEQALAMTGSARSGMRMSKEIWDELHGEAMEETEREEADACAPTKSELEALIGKCGGNLSAAAKELNKDRRQIYRWIEKHGIEIMKFREKKT